MTVLVSGEFPKIAASLKNRGINCLFTKPDGRLPIPVRYHADLQFLPVKKGRGFRLRSSKLAIPGYELADTAAEPFVAYPGDCLCNALFLGNKLFYCPKALDGEVLRYAEAEGFQLVRVKQGYTRCSVCVVSDTAIITADADITRAARHLGIEVLEIPCGFISLPGYPHGFIGGACGKIGNTLYFTGRLDSHPGGQDIQKFCAVHGVTVCELLDGPLLDIGGILQI